MKSTKKSGWFDGTKQEIFDSMVYRARTSGYDPITDTYGTFDLGIDYYETYIYTEEQEESR